MSNIDINNHGISKLENIIIESIRTIENYIWRLEDIQDCIKEINDEKAPLYYVDYWGVQIESLYMTLQLLRNIQYKKRKFLKVNKFKD